MSLTSEVSNTDPAFFVGFCPSPLGSLKQARQVDHLPAVLHPGEAHTARPKATWDSEGEGVWL